MIERSFLTSCKQISTFYNSHEWISLQCFVRNTFWMFL